jgi:DNA-binding MarR family transcriptional regulator
LAVLQEHSGATMGALADLTSVDRTTLTRTLGLMESAGLIARRERKSDRRSLTIALTANGRRMFARILPLTLAETDRALTGFSAKESGILKDRLRRMADNLKAP